MGFYTYEFVSIKDKVTEDWKDGSVREFVDLMREDLQFSFQYPCQATDKNLDLQLLETLKISTLAHIHRYKVIFFLCVFVTPKSILVKYFIINTDAFRVFTIMLQSAGECQSPGMCIPSCGEDMALLFVLFFLKNSFDIFMLASLWFAQCATGLCSVSK